MANVWGSNPIILDTVNDDAGFLVANDGTKFSTKKYKIKSIGFAGAANTNQVELTQVSVGSAGGSITGAITFETGDLNRRIDFGDGLWVSGICPKTIEGSTKVLIYL